MSPPTLGRRSAAAASCSLWSAAWCAWHAFRLSRSIRSPVSPVLVVVVIVIVTTTEHTDWVRIVFKRFSVGFAAKVAPSLLESVWINGAGVFFSVYALARQVVHGKTWREFERWYGYSSSRPATRQLSWYWYSACRPSRPSRFCPARRSCAAVCCRGVGHGHVWLESLGDSHWLRPVVGRQLIVCR